MKIPLRYLSPGTLPSSAMKKPVTTALENFAEGLEQAGIDPAQGEVSLPLGEWQTLANILDQEAGEMVVGVTAGATRTADHDPAAL